MKLAPDRQLLAAVLVVTTAGATTTALYADGPMVDPAPRAFQTGWPVPPTLRPHYVPETQWQRPPNDRPGVLVRLPPVESTPPSHPLPPQYPQPMPYGRSLTVPVTYAAPTSLAPPNNLPAPPPPATTQSIQVPPLAAVTTSQHASPPASEAKPENPFAMSKIKSPFASPDPRYIPEKVAGPRWFERVLRR